MQALTAPISGAPSLVAPALGTVETHCANGSARSAIAPVLPVGVRRLDRYAAAPYSLISPPRIGRREIAS
jgi:hypothetical protein